MRKVILLVVLLGACNTPGIGFHGRPVVQTTVEGSTFDLRRNGDLVQAIRVNRERRPRIVEIAARAEQAIETQYGCAVTKIGGDVAVLTAKLDCDRPWRIKERATWVKGRSRHLDCTATRETGWRGWGDIWLDCY
jgi:hypothetical protein